MTLCEGVEQLGFGRLGPGIGDYSREEEGMGTDVLEVIDLDLAEAESFGQRRERKGRRGFCGEGQRGQVHGGNAMVLA